MTERDDPGTTARAGGDAPPDRLPSALDRLPEIRGRIGDRTPALFLDYDGTLTPIVEDPDAATLPEATRRVLQAAARRVPVAVISGRDLEDVRGLVGLEGIWYAGSHGFDLADPGGEREQRAQSALPALEEAEARLRDALEGPDGVPGVAVERKRFAVAVHYRGVPQERVPEIRRRTRRVADALDGLRVTGGKKVFEIRPDVDWGKGRTVRWLWRVLDLDPTTHHPIYIGDDLTDEDAFRALAGDPEGTGIVVRGGDDRRETRARYALEDPAEVRAFLEGLTQEAAEGG